MVVLEKSPWIECVESEIVELHRSTSAANLPLGDSSPLPAQAFLCFLKTSDGPRIYLAFFVREFRRSLICSVSSPGENPEDSLNTARALAAKFGFRMERVNLKYSPAMRMVILGEVPVLISPENARKLRKKQAAQQAEWNLIANQSAEGVKDSPGRRAGTSESRAAAALQAIRQLETVKRQEENMTEVSRQFERFLGELTALDKMGRPPTETVPEAGSTANMEPATTDQVQLEEVPGNVRPADLEDAKGNRLLELEESFLQAKELITLQRNDLELRQREEATAKERIIELTRELAVLQGELQASHSEMAEKEAAALAQAERADRLDRIVSAIEQELIAERSRNALLLSTLEGMENRLTELKETLRLAEEGSASSGEAWREELNRLQEQLKITEIRAAEQRAEWVQELESSKAGLHREREVRSRLEKTLADAEEKIADLQAGLPKFPAAPRSAMGKTAEPGTAEAARRLIEMEAALRQAREEADLLRLEVEHLSVAAAKACPLPPSSTAAAIPAEKEPTGVENHPGGHSVPRPNQAPSPRTLRRPPRQGALFRVDWDLTGVPCSSIEDLCEAYQGTSMVQLCVEGFPNQYCTAHLIVVKKGERKRIFIPFRLTASKEVLVYVPSRQPESAPDFAKTMKDAARFLKTSGIEIEKVPLGHARGHSQFGLDSIRALLLPTKQAGNF